jgi:hypothetical protein
MKTSASHVALPSRCRFSYQALRFSDRILEIGRLYALQRAAPLHYAKATRLGHHMETTMKLFARFFSRRDTNLTTALERLRLAKTMPGQTGAVAAARLGILA